MREGGAGFKIKGSKSTKKSTKKKARVSHKPKSTFLIEGQKDSDTGRRRDSMTQEKRAEERKGGDKKC